MSEPKWIVGVMQRGMGRESYAVCTEDGHPVEATLENITKQAAAQDMYESLKNILIWASTIASLYPGHERNEGTVEGDIAAARAALAKAQGER